MNNRVFCVQSASKVRPRASKSWTHKNIFGRRNQNLDALWTHDKSEKNRLFCYISAYCKIFGRMDAQKTLFRGIHLFFKNHHGFYIQHVCTLVKKLCIDFCGLFDVGSGGSAPGPKYNFATFVDGVCEGPGVVTRPTHTNRAGSHASSIREQGVDHHSLYPRKNKFSSEDIFRTNLTKHRVMNTNIEYPIEIFASATDPKGYPATVNEIIFFPESAFAEKMVVRIEFPGKKYVFFEKVTNDRWQATTKSCWFPWHLLQPNEKGVITYSLPVNFFSAFSFFFNFQDMIN